MAVQTVPELFLTAVRAKPRADCFSFRDGHGRWQPVSSVEALRRVMALRHGLRSLGVKPGDRVALLSENRVEWAVSDLGIQCAGAITVPIYPTLLPEAIGQILADCAPVAILVSTGDQAAKVHQIRGGLPSVRDVVAFERTELPDILAFERLLDIGQNLVDLDPAAAAEDCAPVAADSPCSIIYTSGTTGTPKGVVLSHRNFVSNVLAIQDSFPFDRMDRALSFLPLSHVLERMAGFYTSLYAGIGIAFAERMDTVPRDILEVKPHLLISVPRLYEKIYAKALGTAMGAGWPKRDIFFWARGVAVECAARTAAGEPFGTGLKLQQALAEKLVFRKLRSRLGGNIVCMISGGAPLSAKINRFFNGAGLQICEGYGLTETAPVLSCNTPAAKRYGSVGKAVVDTEIRIAADGEIQARGPQVMLGYWNRPEATAEVLAADGWFSTGDIGRLDEDGYLYITDRKKDLIVTAGGKNIAPQPLENRLQTNKYVSQTVVIGDRRPYLSALVVPDFAMLAEFAAARGLDAAGPAALVADPAVQQLFQEQLDHFNAELPGFSQIKKCSLLEQEFTQEAGELTPTMKVKRFAIARKYRDVIDAMYPAETPEDED